MAEKGHTELLPCPFCGSGMVAQGATGKQTISVWCMECGTRGPDAPFPDFCEPVAQIELCHQKWNTRAAVNTYPAVEGLVKALEDLLVEKDNDEADDECELCEGRGTVDAHTARDADDGHGRDEIGCPACIERAHSRSARLAISRFRSLQNGGAE